MEAQQQHSQSNGAAMVSRLGDAFTSLTVCVKVSSMWQFRLMQRRGRTDLLMMLSSRECREELVLEDCLLPARGCATNSSSLLPVTTHTHSY